MLKTWLNDHYFDDPEEILAYLKRPPLRTTLRVSTHLISIDEVKAQLESLLATLHGDSPLRSKYTVNKDDRFDDVLYIDMMPSSLDDCQPLYPEVIIDAKTGQSVLRGADIYIPGIVTIQSKAQRNEKVSVFVDTLGKCKSGFKERFLDDRVFIGNGVALVTREDLFSKESNGKKLEGIGVKMFECIYSSPSLNNVMVSKLFLQNLPSIIASYALEPTCHHEVLDMCAGVGGKTTHIASLMKGKGMIYALDRNKNKLQVLKNHMENLKLSNITPIHMDSTHILKSSTKDHLLPKKLFERILLDPPCSGIGQRPVFTLPLIDSATLNAFSDYQKKLICVAVEKLAVNGILVYSTCTLNPLENEGIVSFVLSNYPDMRLLPITVAKGLGCAGLPNHGLSEAFRPLVRRFIPGRNCDTIAFFIAKFIKIS